jgi:hypothetical protein
VTKIIATIIAGILSFFLVAFTFASVDVALRGCAICEPGPPNYTLALILVVAYATLQWVVWRAWRAACTTGGYRN